MTTGALPLKPTSGSRRCGSDSPGNMVADHSRISERSTDWLHRNAWRLFWRGTFLTESPLNTSAPTRLSALAETTPCSSPCEVAAMPLVLLVTGAAAFAFTRKE